MVYYIDDDLLALDLPQALAGMSPQRRDYLLRYRHEAGRRAGAAAYLLLCQGLRECYGITEPPTFAFGPHGKPYLPEHPDIHFSLSHCREAAACAVSAHPIGIDIESVRSFSPELLSHTMHPTEQEQIRNDPEPQIAFLRLWTRKEAAFKMQGTGITDALCDILLISPHLHFSTIVSPDKRYVYSVCSDRPI